MKDNILWLKIKAVLKSKHNKIKQVLLIINRYINKQKYKISSWDIWQNLRLI